MQYWRRAIWQDERGITFALAAISIPFMLLIAVLTVDVGLLHVARSNLQTALDAAALAAVREGTVAKAITTHQATEFGPSGQIEENKVIDHATYLQYKADGFVDLVKFTAPAYGVNPGIPFKNLYSNGYPANPQWRYRLIDGGYVTEIYEEFTNHTRERYQPPRCAEYEWYDTDGDGIAETRGPCIDWESGYWYHTHADDYQDFWYPQIYVVNLITKNKVTRVVVPSIDFGRATEEAQKVIQMNVNSWYDASGPSPLFKDLQIEQAEMYCMDPDRPYDVVTSAGICPNAMYADELNISYRVVQASMRVKTFLLGPLFYGDQYVTVRAVPNEATSFFKRG